MSSGKSLISKELSKKINFNFLDLDFYIENLYGKKIPEIFNEGGEITFRKIEKETLEHILKMGNNIVLSLGGGTPAYYDNIQTINHSSVSVYLRTSIPVLVQRLIQEKEQRPLIKNINNENLTEFVAKHLFERQVYYNQAQFIIDTDKKTPDEISEEIIHLVEALR